MRAILTNFGTRGDFQPLLALGEELAGHGHELLFAVPDFAEVMIRERGFECVKVVTETCQVRDRVNLLWSTRPSSYSCGYELLELLAPIRARFHQILEDLLRACHNADVLVSGPAQPMARMVHEITGIPFVSVHFSHFGGTGGPAIEQAGEFLVNSFRREIGLPAIREPLTQGANSPLLAIYAMSSYVRPRPENWPSHHRMVGFFFSSDNCRPDSALDRFIEAGPSPVVVTFGSMVHVNEDQLSELLLEAVMKAGCRAVIQGMRETQERLVNRRNIFWTDFVPHDWLFPRASCVILHGGAGTAAATFRAGVPGIFVPHGDIYDQRYWGQLASESGCALQPIPLSQANAETLASAIRESIENKSLRQAAAKLGVKVRAERGVETACKLIESLLAACGERRRC